MASVIATSFLNCRDDFPIFKSPSMKSLVYLDSASSAQKPIQVIDAISHFYKHDYANIHRGIYELSARASKLYEQTRDAVRDFIHAGSSNEIIFTHGTTESINLIATCISHNWKAGDEVILSEMEHHANIVPWYFLKKTLGIVLKIIPVTDHGSLDLTAYQDLFSPRTKMVAVTHVSNVLGTINPIKEIVSIAHAHHALVLVDGAQAAPHMSVNVQELDCDFYTFSAHKAYGPTGVGVLYGKKKLLDNMPPYQGGGDMIETVDFDHVTFAPTPQKFEAGTPPIADVIGLNSALHYLKQIGMKQIYEHEQSLLAYTLNELSRIKDVTLIGCTPHRLGVISFVMKDIHPHDIGTVLDHEGVAVRAGHHCAMPLMKRFNVPATVRISLGIYNHEQDIDAFIQAILLAKRMFG